MANQQEYPVNYRVEQPVERNRWTVGFRLVLAIPQVILVGGPAFFAAGGPGWRGGDDEGIDWIFGLFTGGGLLGIAVFISVVIAWFAILIIGRYPRPLWDFARYYLRWRARVITYVALLRDEYPPFGEGAYPIRFDVSAYPERSSRWRVALRIFLAIPQIIVVVLLGVAWFVISVLAWFVILFTGRYPPALYAFAAGIAQWSLRVEAYVLLLRDEHPPFDFGQLGGPAVQPVPAS